MGFCNDFQIDNDTIQHAAREAYRVANVEFESIAQWPPFSLVEPLLGNSELSSFDGSLCIAKGDVKADVESASPKVKRQKRAIMIKARQREARRRRDIATRASGAARRRRTLHSYELTTLVAREAEQPTVAV